MKIARIERSKHIRDRVLVFPAEGEPLRVTEDELLRFHLYVGKELPDELMAELTRAGEQSQLRARGARMASGKMLSKKEVSDRLQKKGADAQQAAETADWLAEVGAVDEVAYAAAIVRHYSAAFYGERRVCQELQRRGIDRGLWEEALAQLPDSGEQVRAYLQAKGGSAIDAKGRKRLGDALLRRGFSWQDIRPALNAMGAEIEE